VRRSPETADTAEFEAGADQRCASSLTPETGIKLDRPLPEIKPAEVTGILTDAGLPRASWKLTTG
jgi:hypothetical protein